MSYSTFKNIILHKAGLITNEERSFIKEILNTRDTISLRMKFSDYRIETETRLNRPSMKS